MAGPAAVATARVGAALVNATSAGVQSVTGASAPMIAIESSLFGRATNVISGIVNGLVTGTLGARQAAAPDVARGAGSGTQNLQSFSELVAPLDIGNLLWGGTSSGTYYGNIVPRAK